MGVGFRYRTRDRQRAELDYYLPVPVDLFRPYFTGLDGSGNGYAFYKSPQEQRREERETERTCEEAVGENGEDAS